MCAGADMFDGYAAFRGAEDGRKPAATWSMSGANDGMFHAFDGSNGRELFAYVPNGVLRQDGQTGACRIAPVHDSALVRP